MRVTQDIIAIVEAILNENLLDHTEAQDWVDRSEPDEAAKREMKAYIELHPMLKEKYFGKYVAIHGGRLIAYDDNFDALYDRIDLAYPNEFVWMSQVKEEPIETFVIRSPRFIEDESGNHFTAKTNDPPPPHKPPTAPPPAVPLHQ